MKDFFHKQIKNFSHFHEVELRFQDKVVGYSVTAIDRDKMPIGGGTHKNIDTARKIAVSECLERSFVGIMKDDNNHFMTREYPTTSGFAGGFDRIPTQMRAICEGYERWLWEEWIDRGRFIREVKVDPSKLSPIAKLYSSKFDDVNFFKHEFISEDEVLLGERIHFGIVIARKGLGVFPGSRVVFGEEDVWEHSLVEAWRHLSIFTHHHESQYSNIIHKRIFVFGRDGSKAYEVIPKDLNKSMAIPRISLMKEYKTGADFFLWRAICSGFMGWHHGSENRFVY